MPEAETPKPESKPSKTLYVIPPLRKKRTETPVPRAKKVTAKAKPEPKAPPPAPKAKAPPPTPAPEGSDAERFGTLHKTKVTGKSEAWWKKQGMGVLKEQAELRGRLFEDWEIKGDKSQGLPRFKKADYLRVMLELLKKEK